MLASLYYEPLWVFYRGDATLDATRRASRQADRRRARRGRACARSSCRCSPPTTSPACNSQLVPLGNLEALRALQAGQVDAVAVRRRRAGAGDLRRRCTTAHQAHELRRAPTPTSAAFRTSRSSRCRRARSTSPCDIPRGGREPDRHRGDAGGARRPAAARSSTCCTTRRARCTPDRATSRSRASFPTPSPSTSRCRRTPTATTGSVRASCIATCRSSSRRTSSASSSCSCRCWS